MDPKCELYLRLGGEDLPDMHSLEGIVAAAMPAAVLISKPLFERPGNRSRLETVVSFIKRQNIVVLFEDKAGLAAKLKADGVHVTGGEAEVREMREFLGEDAYIGVSSPLLRHEAMVFAEAGANYVAFGRDGGSGPEDFEQLVEMTRWWGEIIELPCAIWLDADTVDAQIRELIEAGADYLAPEVTANADMVRLVQIAELVKSTG